MAGPRHKATHGVDSNLYVDGVYVGMVQNANFNRVFQKVAVVQAGSSRDVEHVFGGVKFTLSIGFIKLITKTLMEQGLLPPDTEEALLELEGKTFEFRRVKDDRLIIRAEEVTVSNDNLQFSRDTVWGHNVNFDATWFKYPKAGT